MPSGPRYVKWYRAEVGALRSDRSTKSVVVVSRVIRGDRRCRRSRRDGSIHGATARVRKDRRAGAATSELPAAAPSQAHGTRCIGIRTLHTTARSFLTPIIRRLDVSIQRKDPREELLRNPAPAAPACRPYSLSSLPSTTDFEDPSPFSSLSATSLSLAPPPRSIGRRVEIHKSQAVTKCAT